MTARVSRSSLAALAAVPLALAVQLGCGGSAPEPEAPKPDAWVPPDPDAAIHYEAGEDGGVDLLLRTTKVGQTYRAYFAETDRLAALSKAIAPCLSGQAEVVITHDPSTSEGRIVLVVPRGRLSCPATVTDDGLDVSPLLPLTKGLAAYRRGMGETRDMRIHSWKTGVLFDDAGGRNATLWLAGQVPEDGSTVSVCVDIDSTQHCPDGAERSQGATVLTVADDKARKALATYLGAR